MEDPEEGRRKVKLTQECSTRWYRLSDWKGRNLGLRLLTENGRKIGVALGPIMFFWEWK